MKSHLFTALLIIAVSSSYALAQDETWPMGSRQLLEQAKRIPELSSIEKYSPSYLPTSDGKSYLLVWIPKDTTPTKWLVSLSGTSGYATKDFSIWLPFIKNREIGFIGVQWWLGKGDATSDYYTPSDIYREIDLLLEHLKIQTRSAILHGFSRGSANIYAVAALDNSKGHQYFSYYVANAGGASMGYPPTQSILEGVYGDQPFKNTKWITVAGAKDQNPERDGIPAMRRTSEWLQKFGAEISLSIEDKNEGHGALHLNPGNAKKVLNIFLSEEK